MCHEVVTLVRSAYAFGLRKHIAIDVLQSSVEPETQKKLIIVVECVIILFALLILILGGIRFVYVTFKLGQISSVMQIPKGWIYLALPVSGIIIIFYNLLNIIDALKTKDQL